MLNNQKTVAEVIKNTLFDCMKKNKNIILFGEGIDDAAAMFGTTKGSLEKFGKKRVFEMPLSENCIIGAAIGSALMGDKVIVNFQRVEFALLAMEQIINNAAKINYITRGKHSVSIVLRLVVGRGWGQGPSHSQSLESLFSLIPGLKVFMPVFPEEAKNLLYEAINDANPVIFIENRWCHYNYGNIKKKYIRKNSSSIHLSYGNDITIVSNGYSSVETLNIVKFLKKYKINIDHIHIRIFKPLDIKKILESVRKTKKIILIESGLKEYGISSEILSLVTENFSNFKKKPIRIGLPTHPIPSSKIFIKSTYLNHEQVIENVLNQLDFKKNRIKEIIKEYKFLFEKNLYKDTPNEQFKGPF
jgi:pyruvate dehydrogenase E1 component beta subunit